MRDRPERRADPQGTPRRFSTRDDGQRHECRVIDGLEGESFPGRLYFRRSDGPMERPVAPVADQLVLAGSAAISALLIRAKISSGLSDASIVVRSS